MIRAVGRRSRSGLLFRADSAVQSQGTGEEPPGALAGSTLQRRREPQRRPSQGRGRGRSAAHVQGCLMIRIVALCLSLAFWPTFQA